MKAYLDIETSFAGSITIIGLYRPDQGIIQLVDQGVSQRNLLASLEDIETICTYNGSRFDLPVISRWLAVDLVYRFHCHDLMYDCWRNNLFGGLKRVEEQLSIPRQTQGIDGMEAMHLWERYKTRNDKDALAVLLKYNREDAFNLLLLERRLAGLPLEGEERELHARIMSDP